MRRDAGHGWAGHVRVWTARCPTRLPQRGGRAGPTAHSEHAGRLRAVRDGDERAGDGREQPADRATGPGKADDGSGAVQHRYPRAATRVGPSIDARRRESYRMAATENTRTALEGIDRVRQAHVAAVNAGNPDA